MAGCSVPCQVTLERKYGDWVCLGLSGIQSLGERVLGVLLGSPVCRPFLMM